MTLTQDRLEPEATDRVPSVAGHRRVDEDHHGVTARVCTIGAGPVRCSVSEISARAEASVLWLDVDADAEPKQVLTILQRCDPKITRALVEDLLSRDELPKVEQCSAGMRSISIVGVEAHGAPDTRASSGHPGELVFQMVETLVGDSWIVTCWQHSRLCAGISTDRDDAPVLKDTVVPLVEAAWTAGRCQTAGDVGTHLAEAVTDRYKHAHRELEKWLQQWELDFHSSRESVEPATLKNLLALVNESRRRLAAFNYAHCLMDNGAWFPGLTTLDVDRRADASLDHALRKLTLLFENIRADMELVCMEKMVEQAEAATEQRAADDRFQRQLGKITALLLVPTLIAGVFGANTQLPGGGTWLGFAAMLVMMFATSFVVYRLMVRPDTSEWTLDAHEEKEQWPPQRLLRRTEPS